jgi:hypothetical protein
LVEFEGFTTVGTSVLEIFEPSANDKLGRQLETLDKSTEFDGSTGAENGRIFETF